MLYVNIDLLVRSTFTTIGTITVFILIETKTASLTESSTENS